MRFASAPFRHLKSGTRMGVLVAVAAALSVGAVAHSQRAEAATVCSFAGGVVTVTMGGADAATISRTPGGDFEVSGAGLAPTDCDTGGGPATITDTDTVDVTGAGGDNVVTIDLSNGPFAPGATAEASGTNADDIEFVIELVGGTDTLIVAGSTAADDLRIGAGGINLNGDSDNDGDTDVEYGGTIPEKLTIGGRDGSDVISAQGGRGTGGTLGPGDSATTISGSDGPDTITGGDGDDALNGNADADDIKGGSGNDTVDGGAGDDVLDGETATDGDTVSYASAASGVTVVLAGGGQATGGAGADELTGFENLSGSKFADDLTGDGAVNVLTGGDGDDVLEGRGGGDVLVGDNASEDTATYASSPGAVSVDLQTPAASGNDAAGDTFVDLHNLAGSAFADTLTGNGTPNVISGGDGNDLISGGADVSDDGVYDDDILLGGGGNDTVTYAGRIDVEAASLLPAPVSAVIGGPGRVDVEPDTIADPDPGFEESDTIGPDVENLTGADAADALKGSEVANRLIGGGGADALTGLGGDDEIVGDTSDTSSGFFGTASAGPDTIKGGDGDDIIYGDNRVIQSFGALETADDPSLDGGNGNDTIYGDNVAELDFGLRESGGSDTLVGGEGDDALFGSNVVMFFDGAGALTGGLDQDTASYASSPAGVTVDLTLSGAALPLPSAPGTPQDTGGAGTDTLSDIDSLTGSDHADTLTGDGAANVLEGDAGADRLIGSAGFDTLEGEAGDDVLIGGVGAADTITGGTGVDTLSYETSTVGLTIDLTASTTGDGGDELLDTLENAIGGSGNDVFTGTTGPNLIDGGPGNSDVVTYAARTTALEISLDDLANDGGDGEGDNVRTTVEGVIGGSEDDTIVGSGAPNDLDGGGGADTIKGLNGADVINGDAGGDVLDGGGGTDDLNGGPGDDDIVEGSARNGADDIDGGSGFDRVLYTARVTRVVVDLDDVADDGQRGEGDNVRGTVEGVEGGRGDDRITGNGAANELLGNEGDDVLKGGAGADEIAGGAGADVLLARDGVRDVVRGNGGRDRGRVDRRLDSVTGVERLF